MSVFVTDGNQRSTLAVVRALGRSGISVTVGESEAPSLAASSRYCANALRYPSPLDGARVFIRALVEEVSRGGYRMLLPMSDVTMRLVARERKALERWVALPIPDEDQVVAAQDKRQILLLARQLGIPTPDTFMLDESDRLEDVARRISFPAVIKPRFSSFFCGVEPVEGQVEYARSPEELITKYSATHARIPFPLVQEKITGEGRGVFLLVWGGELKAAFCHRRLREKPPWGGVSVYSESVPPDQGLVEKSFALLKAIGWKGVAMVEFKTDQRDGQAKLMEVNGRFWGSLQLAIDAGMNFPLLLYLLATGQNVPAQFSYQVSVKNRWLLGDLDQLLIRLSHTAPPNGSGMQPGSRLKACLSFLKFYEPNLHYEVLRWDDPRPGALELKTYLRQTFRQLGRRSSDASQH